MTQTWFIVYFEYRMYHTANGMPQVFGRHRLWESRPSQAELVLLRVERLLLRESYCSLSDLLVS